MICSPPTITPNCSSKTNTDRPRVVARTGKARVAGRGFFLGQCMLSTRSRSPDARDAAGKVRAVLRKSPCATRKRSSHLHAKCTCAAARRERLRRRERVLRMHVRARVFDAQVFEKVLEKRVLRDAKSLAELRRVWICVRQHRDVAQRCVDHEAHRAKKKRAKLLTSKKTLFRFRRKQPSLR